MMLPAPAVLMRHLSWIPDHFSAIKKLILYDNMPESPTIALNTILIALIIKYNTTH